MKQKSRKDDDTDTIKKELNPTPISVVNRNDVETSEEKEAQAYISSILGQKIKCTLDDGRTATGEFICLDRLKNIILQNVTEERLTIVPPLRGNDGECLDDKQGFRRQRRLSQAMIPGKHLVKVHLLDDGA